MPKQSKHDRKRLPIVIPIVGDAPRSETGAARADASAVSGYGQLLGGRNRYVDERHRAQQRMDQVVAGSAAGALVLSATFARGIASAPPAWAVWLLAAAWLALAAALGASLAHHHLARRAFDGYVRQLDRAFGVRDFPDPQGAAARLPVVASLALLAGLICLAAFALLNLGFA